MPGRSRCAVVLTEEERSELERRAARYTLPHKQVQRAKLILYAAEGLTNVEIGARLEINPKVVGRWRRRFCEDRLDGLEDKARLGRPRRFPPQQIAEVKAVACEPPSDGCPLSRRSAADVHRLVIDRGICDASQSTIVRWLREDAIRPWQYRSWIFPTDPLRGEGRPDTRPVRGAMGWQAAAPRRVHHLGRREALDSSPQTDRGEHAASS